MITFLKLTPAACERMWREVRYQLMAKHGKSFDHTVSMKLIAARKKWKQVIEA